MVGREGGVRWRGEKNTKRVWRKGGGTGRGCGWARRKGWLRVVVRAEDVGAG